MICNNQLLVLAANVVSCAKPYADNAKAKEGAVYHEFLKVVLEEVVDTAAGCFCKASTKHINPTF